MILNKINQYDSYAVGMSNDESTMLGDRVVCCCAKWSSALVKERRGARPGQISRWPSSRSPPTTQPFLV